MVRHLLKDKKKEEKTLKKGMLPGHYRREFLRTFRDGGGNVRNTHIRGNVMAGSDVLRGQIGSSLRHRVRFSEIVRHVPAVSASNFLLST